MTRRSSSLLILVLIALASCAGMLVFRDVFVREAPPDREASQADDSTLASASRPATATQAITPKAVVESEPARTVEIEVARASGAPIADVPVVVFRDEIVLLSAKTDRAGLVRLAASSGEAHTVAAVPGYRLLEARVAMENERTRLVVPDGLEISGTVQVDGHAPRGTIELMLWRKDEAESFDVPLPSAVRSILDYRYANANWLAVTDDTGGFKFTGLPTTFRGGIDLELPYRVKEMRVGSGKVIELGAPAKDVAVEAGRYIELSGRVVDAADRAPVPDAHIMAGWKSEVSSTTGSGQPCGEDGRFKITVQAEAVTSITLTASAGPGTEPTTIEIKDRFDEDHAVGDIAINRGRLVTMLVHDEAGKPIAGARAVPPLGTRRDCSEPTDPTGRTTLRLGHEAATIKVAALGYGVASVEVPAELASNLDVTLRSDTMLTVRVVRERAPAPGMIVKIKTRRQFLPGSSHAIGGPDEALIAAGMSTPVSWSSIFVNAPFYWFEAGAEGVVRLSGFPPDGTTRIEVTDRSGAPQFAEDVKLAKGERREVVVTITDGPRTFTGLVTDVGGRPLHEASVAIAHDPKDLENADYRLVGAHVARTSRDGRFTLENICVSRTNVAVAKRGYAGVIQRDVPIPADGADARFTLIAALPVRVTAVDSSGNPVDVPLEVTGTMQGAPIAQPSREGTAVYVFSDCPPGLLEVRARIGNGSASARIDTATEHEAKIRIPVLGNVHFTWAADISDGSQRLLLRMKANDPDSTDMAKFTRTGEKEARFDSVAPGFYTASIQADPRAVKDSAARKPLAEARVEVVEGQTAEVVFKRP